MIPGEYVLKDGEITLNADREAIDARGRQYRRPADPGRLALPLLRDQPGARVRSRAGARLPARHPGRHGGALRARPDPRGQARGLCRRAPRLRLQRPGDGPAGRRGLSDRNRTDPTHAAHDLSRRLCRHVRPDGRRPGPPRRHRAVHRGRGGPHHLRRGGQVRRRQGDPRRHGPVAGTRAARARSTR